MQRRKEFSHKINKRQVGTAYERVAAAYLINKGYKILNYNYRCKLGEIDLVAWYSGYIIFVEVKYRKRATFGIPCEAVNYYKCQTIRRVAEYYLRAKVGYECKCRFDVIDILDERITHLEAAF